MGALTLEKRISVPRSSWTHRAWDEAKSLTDEVKEGEADEEVGCPVEAAAEGECPASDLLWVDLTKDQPGHCTGESKRLSGLP